MESWKEQLKSKIHESELSVSEISDKTKIPSKYIDAIQEGKFQDLPAEIFAKSQIERLFKFLKIDPNNALRDYEEFISPAENQDEEQKIDIKFFNIIYEALEYVEKSLSGLLEPDIKETILGSAEIQKIFKVSNAGKIAGSKVINGEIKNKSKARIIRDGVVVYSGEIQSIYREKNQVKEVGTGLECGISIKDFIDFKEKDVIESYHAEEIQRSI